MDRPDRSHHEPHHPLPPLVQSDHLNVPELVDTIDLIESNMLRLRHTHAVMSGLVSKYVLESDLALTRDGLFFVQVARNVPYYRPAPGSEYHPLGPNMPILVFRLEPSSEVETHLPWLQRVKMRIGALPFSQAPSPNIMQVTVLDVWPGAVPRLPPRAPGYGQFTIDVPLKVLRIWADPAYAEVDPDRPVGAIPGLPTMRHGPCETLVLHGTEGPEAISRLPNTKPPRRLVAHLGRHPSPLDAVALLDLVEGNQVIVMLPDYPTLGNVLFLVEILDVVTYLLKRAAPPPPSRIILVNLDRPVRATCLMGDPAPEGPLGCSVEIELRARTAGKGWDRWGATGTSILSTDEYKKLVGKEQYDLDVGYQSLAKTDAV